MTYTFRTIDPGEFEAYLRAGELAFSSAPNAEDVERERSLHEPDRSFAAFDGDRIVGTSAAFSMPMSVPGGDDIPVGYLTLVGVAATHRRRGINTELMRRQIDDARARGETVSALVASEGGIYGRYGYGLAIFDLAFEIPNARTAFVRGVEPTGEIMLTGDMPMREILAINEVVRAERPGMIALDEKRYRYWIGHDHGPEKDLPKLFAVHEGVSGIDGYVAYRVKHSWPDGTPANQLEVLDLQATDAAASASLWRYVFDVDLVDRTSAWGRPVDEPLLHLLREPRRLRAKLSDGVWIRLVDVERALAARRYASAGRVVLEVADPFCAWNDGRFLVEADDEGVASVERTDEEPDLSCSVTEVGAAYLGGTSFRQLRRALRIREGTPDGCARADAMFAWDPAPWSPFDY